MPSQQTQALYAESKERLADRVQGSVNSAGSIARQVVRGSQAPDLLSQAMRTFAQTDVVTDSTFNNLQRATQQSAQMKLNLMNMRIIEMGSTCERLDRILAKDRP